jgi:hypothetical protein
MKFDTKGEQRYGTISVYRARNGVWEPQMRSGTWRARRALRGKGGCCTAANVQIAQGRAHFPLPRPGKSR